LNEKIQLHVPIENALQDFAEMVHHPDIDFFVESTILQLRTGGNLVKLFQKVAELVEEKRKLARDIKSFTSQGKMSGILIAVLYPVSLILFALLAPSHVETLFYTTSGQCLLVLSLILELIGFACIWKIIRVKI
jgi:tight adherence protein B